MDEINLNDRIIPNDDDEINLKNQNEEKFKENYNEVNETIDKEKKRLLERFAYMRNQIENKSIKTIDDVYLSYSEEDFLKNRDIRKEKINKHSIRCYKVLLFIITTIYLAGSFIIVSLKKSFWNLFLSSLECRLDAWCDKEEFKKRANFFKYFYEQLLREPIDLNLIMFWNFLGIKLSNSLGFRISSLIILIANCLIFFLTYNIYYDEYDNESCKYSYLMVGLLLFNCAIMAISFGASSLIAQQKFIDYYSILDEDDDYNEIQYQNIEMSNPPLDENINNDIKSFNSNNSNNNLNQNINVKEKIVKQNNKIKEKNLETLFLFCLSSILGFSIKYGISYLFTYYNGLNYYTNSETIYNKTDSINLSNNNYIFESNYSDTNETIIINNDSYKEIYLYIGSIYIVCIFISVFLLYSLVIYYFFINKEKECCKCDGNNDNNCCVWKIACEMCGCIIYFERIILDEQKTNNHGCCTLCCESLNKYCNDIICNVCNCRKNKENNLCSRCQFNENDFDKEKQCFCYCFQTKGFCFWINKYLINKTQKEIIFCMILFLISRLSIIGCQKNYENELGKKSISKEVKVYMVNIAFLFGILLFIFLFYILSNSLLNIKKDISEEIEKLNLNNNFTKLIILCLISFVSFFLIFCGLIYSLSILFFGFDYTVWGDKEFAKDNDLYAIAIANAFYNLLINCYCLIISKNQIDLELIFSQTKLVTVYLIIIDGTIFLLQKLLQNDDNLFIMQLVITSIFAIPMLIIFLRPCLLFFIKCSSYDKGTCYLHFCCCNEKSCCYKECCILKCSKCDLSYLCCEPCTSKIKDCIIELSQNQNSI